MNSSAQTELLKQAINHYEEDNTICALSMFKKYLVDNPNDLIVLQYIGESQRLLYMIDDAFSTLSLVYEKSNGDEKACVAGRIALLLSDHRSKDDAELWYERGMNCANTYIDWIWVLRGINLVKMGRPIDGIQQLEEAIKLGCENPDEAYVNIALAKRALGLNSDARQYAMSTLELDSENEIAKMIVRQVEVNGEHLGSD